MSSMLKNSYQNVRSLKANLTLKVNVINSETHLSPYNDQYTAKV